MDREIELLERVDKLAAGAEELTISEEELVVTMGELIVNIESSVGTREAFTDITVWIEVGWEVFEVVVVAGTGDRVGSR
jgi:hypothetical protein